MRTGRSSPSRAFSTCAATDSTWPSGTGLSPPSGRRGRRRTTRSTTGSHAPACASSASRRSSSTASSRCRSSSRRSSTSRRRGTAAPVEIEFAANLSVPAGQPMEFGFLQLRPLALAREEEVLTIGDPDPAEVLCRSRAVLGNGRIEGVMDIVVVDVHRFDRSRSRAAAAEVARLNARLVAAGVRTSSSASDDGVRPTRSLASPSRGSRSPGRA